jgi:tetratricopeptide (TPR) repeat protein
MLRGTMSKTESMQRENHAKKALFLGMSGIFFLFTLVGCSTMNGMFSSGNYWDKPVWHYAQPSKKNIALLLPSHETKRGNPDSHYRLGSYYQESGRHSEAIDEFKKTIYIDLSYIKAFNRLGVSYHSIGEFSHAIETYKTALKLESEADYVLNNLGYSYLVTEYLDDAIESFQRAIALNSAEKKYYNNLALTYAKKGDFDLALSEFLMAGDEARAHYNLAFIFYEKGLYNNAIKHLQKALTINPQFKAAKARLEAAESLARITQLSDKTVESAELIRSNRESPVLKKESSDYLTKTHILRYGRAVDNVISSQQRYITEGAIEVSNGNGINRMAQKVGNFLKGKGFEVSRLTNADNFNHSGTVIYYQNGYSRDARSLAEQMPRYHRIEEVAQFDRSNIHIKILIGKDIVPYRELFIQNGQES